VESYSALTPPEIQVQAVYPGATAQDVADAVAGADRAAAVGMKACCNFKSANSSDGHEPRSTSTSRAILICGRGRAEQIALAAASCRRKWCATHHGRKRQTAFLVVLALSSDDPRYDTEYLTTTRRSISTTSLKRLPGVGECEHLRTARLLDAAEPRPRPHGQLGLTVSDVAAAVQEQNATNPAGRIGREPAPPGTQLTIPVITSGG